MAKALHSLYVKIKMFLNGKTTRGQVLPPYLLIGLVWWLGTVSDARERTEERVEAAINIAELQYLTDLQLAQQKAIDRKDCIDDVIGRNNTITNWQNLFDFLRSEPGVEEFAERLEANFNGRSRNEILTVEEHCAAFPNPEPVEIPEILIEEGIFIHGND